MAEIRRVREPFAFDLPNGVQRVMRVGDLVSTDDPAYKGKEHLYESVETAAARATETATAGPGERRVRSTRRGRGKTEPAETKPAEPTAPVAPEAEAIDKAGAKPNTKPESKTDTKAESKVDTKKSGE